MPPKGKAKNAPNPHDKRHESGLAAPGKRVARKLSNGQLNGQINGKPASPVLPPALPSTGLNQGFRFPRPADSAAINAETTSHSSAKDNETVLDRAARDRTSSEASVEVASAHLDMAESVNELPSTGSNVEATPSDCKNHAAQTGNTLSAVSTILAYYPLRDAISILILLLSLPPTLVLVIQTLFASLTFVPPTAGLSLSTLPNVKEMFNASNLGYPALATILIVDLLFWLCWLPVWKPVQNIFLDLSQAVIAVSLSGAATSTGGPTYSIATCTLTVCVVHVLRYKAIHLTALDYLRSVIHKLDVNIPFDVPPLATSFLSSAPVERGWVYTVVRTILGIHLVSQGVTTCIRRSLVKANERDQSLPAITKSDPDGSTAAEPVSRSATASLESTSQSTTVSNTDRATGQSPNQRENRPRESSSKKKKKQANQVRSQQPLWAAVASTKVTFVKEMEQRDAADDARDAAAMNTDGPATFTNVITSITDRIWISEVRATEVMFNLDLSPDAAEESIDRISEGMSITAGIDKSKPFYVRINGASWSSTRIMSSAIGEPAKNDHGRRFDGEIFGLAPLSSYHCEIVGIASGKVLCSASLITQVAPSAEQASVAPVQQQHPALRPSSPITTLKQSILSAEAKLNETRNRTRKSKKDQRGIHSDIRKEINMLKSKMESSGGLDDKQERRLMQINQHKTQAEEATADFKQQIETLGEIPSDELAESETVKRSWQTALQGKNSASRDLDEVKAEADREVSALKSEIQAAEAKRDRLATRHVQRTQELERLVSKQQADMTAKQKRDYERAQAIQARQDEESQLRFHIANMEAETNGLQQKAQETYQQIAALQSWPTPTSAYPGYSSPPTPEGTLSGLNGSLSPQSNGFPPFNPHAFQSPFHSAHPSASSHPVPRGRSSSMLSQYSGFTDNGDEYTFPENRQHQHPWPAHGHATAGAHALIDRKESEGSGSLNNGSTGSNSPANFVPTKMSPIGPPSKARERAPQSPGQAAGSTGSGR